ncbi:MAG: hypothetical protein KAG97_01790 [Victivallales bacterium]|nr:hypothetical protein [Victivallales bacterium]
MKVHIRIVVSFYVLFILLLSWNLRTHAELPIYITKPPKKTSASRSGGSGGSKTSVAKSDLAFFKNGDSLHGKLLSFSSKKGMIWKSPEAESEIIFKLANLREIRLGAAKNFTETCQDSILLTNGDELFGKIISLDSEKLIIETPFAGRLTVGRSMLESITPGNGKGSDTYTGPTTIDEWKVVNQNGRNGSPSVVDGIMSLPRYTAVSRDMNPPPVFKISFKFENFGSSQFSIRFCASTPDVNNRRSVYMLSISQNYVYLQRFLNNSNKNLGNVRIREFRTGKGEVTILCDSKKKVVIMLVNGKMKKQWSDPQFPPVGKYVIFYNQSSGILKLSKIAVGKWNGKIQGSKSEGDAKKDTIEFTNDDKVTGKLKSLDAKLAVFDTDYAPLKVPVTRIKQITFANGSRGRARRNVADARCVFVRGGHVTVNVENIANGVIVGESENCGKATFKLNAFKKVELNIYDD